MRVDTFDRSSFATPFGGFKRSGFGRDRSPRAMDKPMDAKTLWTKLRAALLGGPEPGARQEVSKRTPHAAARIVRLLPSAVLWERLGMSYEKRSIALRKR